MPSESQTGAYSCVQTRSSQGSTTGGVTGKRVFFFGLREDSKSSEIVRVHRLSTNGMMGWLNERGSCCLSYRNDIQLVADI